LGALGDIVHHALTRRSNCAARTARLRRGGALVGTHLGLDGTNFPLQLLKFRRKGKGEIKSTQWKPRAKMLVGFLQMKRSIRDAAAGNTLQGSKKRVGGIMQAYIMGEGRGSAKEMVASDKG